MTATPAESREELEKLERKHADNPEGRYFVPLANAYRKAGEVDRATSLLRDGLERHPDYLSAHIVLGRCLADRGDSAAADAEFRHVLSLDPQNLIALRTLGELAMASGKVEEARSWYGDLLSVDPMNEDARRALDSIARVPAPLDFAADDPKPAEQTPLVRDATVAEERRETVPDIDSGEFFGTMVDLDSSAEGEVGLPEEAEAVVTETIAELYTRQGFYDRAADVYRELIRRRGGDQSLEERLRRVVALASAETDAEASGGGAPGDETTTAAGWMEDEPVAPGPDSGAEGARLPDEPGWISLPADEVTSIDNFESVGDISSNLVPGLRGERPESEMESGDSFADSFTEGFSFQDAGGAGSVRGVDSVPDMWSQEAGSEGEAGGGATIRDFIRDVVGWAPSAASSGAPVDGEAGRDDDMAVDAGLLADTAFLDDPSYFGGAGGFDQAPLEKSPPAIEGEGFFGAETARQPDERSDADDFELLQPPITRDSDDLFPWEIPDADTDPLAADVPSLDALQLDNGYPFDDLPLESPSAEEDDPGAGVDLPFTGPVIDLSSAEDLPPSTSVQPDLEPATEPEPRSEAEPEPEPRARHAAPEPHDDDDLESFQAWLRSLKH